MPQPDVYAVFVERLKQARAAAGLSQAALGREIGLPDETASTRINRYERGVSEPDLRTAEAVADALGVSLSWLVCTDPKLAGLIEAYGKLPPGERRTLLARAGAAAKAEEKRRRTAKPGKKTPASRADTDSKA